MADTKAEQFITFLRPHQGTLEAVCRRLLWDRSSCPDVLQSAVMTAWTRFETFEPGRSFKAWIFSILVNTVLNANRAFRRQSSLENSVSPETIDYLETLSKEQAYQQVLKDPEGTVSRFGPQLSTALSELNPLERGAFLMRGIGELKYSEIAEALGIPIGTVMSHLHRARRKLRETLAELAVPKDEGRSVR